MTRSFLPLATGLFFLLSPFLSRAQGAADYGGFSAYDSLRNHYVWLFAHHQTDGLVLKKGDDKTCLVQIKGQYGEDFDQIVWVHNVPDSLAVPGLRVQLSFDYPTYPEPKQSDTTHPHVWFAEGRRKYH